MDKSGAEKVSKASREEQAQVQARTEAAINRILNRTRAAPTTPAATTPAATTPAATTPAATNPIRPKSTSRGVRQRRTAKKDASDDENGDGHAAPGSGHSRDRSQLPAKSWASLLFTYLLAALCGAVLLVCVLSLVAPAEDPSSTTAVATVSGSSELSTTLAGYEVSNKMLKVSLLGAFIGVMVTGVWMV